MLWRSATQAFDELSESMSWRTQCENQHGLALGKRGACVVKQVGSLTDALWQASSGATDT